MQPRRLVTLLARASARLAVLLAAVAGTAGAARAFSGTIAYTGDLGPISAQRPLCLCVFTMPDLSNGIGCVIYRRNNVGYDPIVLGDRDYYLVAFVDLHINERLDRDEPFQIYRGRGRTPADPLNGRSTAGDVDFAFGDENLPAAAPTPTPTPPAGIAGDCDGDGGVTVAELVRAVGIALEALPLSECPSADRDGDGAVRIEELVAALAAALDAG